MAEEKKVHFIWEKQIIQALWRRSNENSYLIVVANPSPDMEEKYTNRMIISKKACETAELVLLIKQELPKNSFVRGYFW